MDATVADSPTFHRFSSLPPEIRMLIWWYAIPKYEPPALFFYQAGLWRSLEPKRRCRILEYMHQELDCVSVMSTALHQVNHEARMTAIGYNPYRKLNENIREDRDEQMMQLPTRTFDLNYDALFIAGDQWNAMFHEPIDLMFDTGGEHEFHPGFRYLAITEELFADVFGKLPGVIDSWALELLVLFVILDAPPDLHFQPSESKTQRRWELENLDGSPTFGRAWDNRARWQAEDVRHKPLENKIQKVHQEIYYGNVFDRHRWGVDIRPVVAVRR